MNVVINTNYNTASTRVCVDDLGDKFVKAGHKVVHNDWTNYQNYELILFMAYDSEVKKAKKINPQALIGIMCPYLAEEKHRQEAKLADFLLVDSIEMRDIFLQYNYNIIIYYMFPQIKEVANNHIVKEKIIIGYHGNKVHLNCMDDASKALDELAGEYDVEFWAIYNIKQLGKWSRNAPKKCKVRHIQWSEDDYYKYLAQCDIGAVPAKIPINLTIGKFATRLTSSFLQNWPSYGISDYLIRFKHPTNPGRVYAFSQLHIPIVADFLPSYCQIIQDGESGYLTYSKEGWYDALEKLIKSAELRNQMSRNLKNFIDNNCSPGINFRNFLEFLNLFKARKITT